MATKKTSTRGNTKTAKKPVKSAAKSNRKTTAASAAKKSTTKAVKKPATSKATKAVAEQKVTNKKPVSVFGLERLNQLSALVAVVAAAAAGFLMNSTAYQVFSSMLTKDVLASANSTVFVPAVHAWADLELRWVVVAILGLSALVPLLAATRNRSQYEASLKQKVMLWRWIDTGIISGLMLEVTALLSGIQDVSTLKLISTLVILSCLFAWMAERQFAARLSSKLHYVLSVVTLGIAWLVIADAAILTPVYGMIRSPWYVYALYGTMVVAGLGYALNLKNQLQSKLSYEAAERNYLQLNIVTKVAFAAILIVGLYK